MNRPRIFSCFVGFVLVLVLLEAGLRIVGIVQFRKSVADKRASKSIPTATRVVLCVGDSFTQGYPGSAKDAYPQQLERLLNSSGENKIVVINRGRNAQNSSELVNFLPDAILETKPDLVVLLTGDANLWNFNGYHAFLRGSGPRTFLADSLYRIRVFRLAKLLFVGVKDRMSKPGVLPLSDAAKEARYYADQGQQCITAGKEDDAVEWFKKGAAAVPQSGECFLRLGWVYMWRGNYAEAEEWFRKGIEAEPENGLIYSELGLLFFTQGKYDEAYALLAKAPKWNRKTATDFYDFYSSHVFLFKRQAKYDEAMRFFREIAKTRPEARGYAELFEKKEKMSEEIGKWIKSDIEKAIKICRDNDVSILIQDYPKNNVAGYDLLARNIAETNGIPFVNQQAVFHSMLAAGADEKDYFVPDGHCNARGYGVMAENIAKTILELKIFGNPSRD